MRLAYLSADPGVPVLGARGSSVHVQETVRALRALGHDVRIFTPNPGADDDSALREGIEGLPLAGFAAVAARCLAEEPAAPGISDHWIKEVSALLYAEQIRHCALMTAFRPEAIYERYALFASGGVGLADRLGIPHLLEVNAPLRWERATFGRLDFQRTAEELERLVLGASDRVIVVSAALSDHARRLGVPAERITVMPNAADSSRFHPGVSGNTVRARFGLLGKRVVGFVGSLKPWHDVDTVARAVRLLAAGDVAIDLLVVGEGPCAGALRETANDAITFVGAVPHREVPEMLAAMDVVVVPLLPGETDYFSPLKLFEAMAMGKPVVGARIGQVADVLAGEELGLLYEPGDAADLARKLQAVLARPERGAALGSAARRWVGANRTWELNARRIAELAQSAIEVPRGPGPL